MVRLPNASPSMENHGWYCGKSRRSAVTSSARSRAVVYCSGENSPLGLTKCEPVMPSLAASAFMRSANAACEPPIFSATVMAMSLADFTSIISSAVSSRITVPGLSPIFDGGSAAACLVILIGESSATSPAWMARKAT